MHSVKYYTLQIISLMQKNQVTIIQRFPSKLLELMRELRLADTYHLPTLHYQRQSQNPFLLLSSFFAITERAHRIIKQHSDS